MSKQILVVFGATGNQGGSVVNTFLDDPELAKKYHIRAVSRDTNKAAAKALEKKGAEIIQGDTDDASSLPRVLQGAHAVYLATFTDYVADLKEREIRQGKAVADAAVAAGVKQIVFCTLPACSILSNHKYNVAAFDCKYEIEQYIRTLPIKSTFFSPGSFLQNFHTWLKPKPAGDGTYVLYGPFQSSTELPLIDTAGDTGKWVASAVEHPEKYNYQVFSAFTRIYTPDEIVKTISMVSGKTVKFQPISIDTYKSYLPPLAQEPLAAMNEFIVEFGYYGPDTNNLVEHSAKQARGRLTTLEEYLKRDPIQLD